MSCASGAHGWALPCKHLHRETLHLAWEPGHEGWPMSGLGQPVVRTCHTRMNCLKQRETGLQHRTPSMDPCLEDKLLHCTSSSQKAGSTTLGAKVPRNQDGETKLQLFLPTWKRASWHIWAGRKGSSTHPEDKLFSAQLSPSYLHLPPPLTDISWMILSPEVTLNLRDSALHLKLKFVRTCT